jgi:hypothetical protein
MQPGMASGNEGHGEGVRNQERRNFEQIYKEPMIDLWRPVQ